MNSGSSGKTAAASSHTWTRETLISTVLRIGVITSLVLIALGTVVSFVHHPSYLSVPETLGPLTHPGAAPKTLDEVVLQIENLRGQAIVTLGLLLLLATPIARVVLSIFLFARERDRRFVIITTLVFILLLMSFLLGKA